MLVKFELFALIHSVCSLIQLLKVVSGGVASNQYVRTRLNHIAQKNNLQLVSPPPSLCTDNGNKFIDMVSAVFCFLI